MCAFADDAPRRKLRHPIHDLRHLETIRPKQDESRPTVAFGRHVWDRGDCGVGDCLYDYAVGVSPFLPFVLLVCSARI